MKLLDLKYVLIRTLPSSASPDDATAPILGFLSFMPTFEDSVSCLYIYEIHLSPELRGSGLGRHLVEMVEGIASRVEVEKVMLTCFVRNKEARKFYEKLGYVVEEIIEGRKLRGARKTADIDKSGYLIMGKEIRGRVDEKKESTKNDGWEDVDSDEDEGTSNPDSELQKP